MRRVFRRVLILWRPILGSSRGMTTGDATGDDDWRRLMTDHDRG
jgi:hypothetical protein